MKQPMLEPIFAIMKNVFEEKANTFKGYIEYCILKKLSYNRYKKL